MKHIRLFNTTQEYEDFLGSDEFVLPNISLCLDDLRNPHIRSVNSKNNAYVKNEILYVNAHKNNNVLVLTNARINNNTLYL